VHSRHRASANDSAAKSDAYSSLMEEAKSRIASIISILEGRTRLSEIFADE
jgi:hypothetical protein